MYCTTNQLADAGLTRELAQVCTPEDAAIVADDLMEATLRGSDRSAFDAADIVVADEVLTRINQAGADADALIDGHLSMRKPVAYNVPLDPVPPIVGSWAKAILRYLLHKDRVGTAEASDPIVRDYRDALRLLGLTRDGKFALGAGDPLPPPSSGAPQVCAPQRVFDERSMRDFGC